MDIWTFLLIVGAGGWSSWFLTDASLLAPVRVWVSEKMPPWVSKWMGCPWCNSPYTLAGWLAWWALAPDPRWFGYPALVLSGALLYAWAYTLHERAMRPAMPPVTLRADSRQARITTRD